MIEVQDLNGTTRKHQVTFNKTVDVKQSGVMYTYFVYEVVNRTQKAMEEGTWESMNFDLRHTDYRLTYPQIEAEVWKHVRKLRIHDAGLDRNKYYTPPEHPTNKWLQDPFYGGFRYEEHLIVTG